MPALVRTHGAQACGLFRLASLCPQGRGSAGRSTKLPQRTTLVSRRSGPRTSGCLHQSRLLQSERFRCAQGRCLRAREHRDSLRNDEGESDTSCSSLSAASMLPVALAVLAFCLPCHSALAEENPGRMLHQFGARLLRTQICLVLISTGVCRSSTVSATESLFCGSSIELQHQTSSSAAPRTALPLQPAATAKQQSGHRRISLTQPSAVRRFLPFVSCKLVSLRLWEWACAPRAKGSITTWHLLYMWEVPRAGHEARQIVVDAVCCM